MRLLVVDDESTCSADVAEWMRRDGVEVATASSRAEALDYLTSGGMAGLDVMLTDNRMPVDGEEQMDEGVALTKAAREAGFGGRIILWSSWVDEGLRLRALGAGANAVTSKLDSLVKLSTLIRQG